MIVLPENEWVSPSEVVLEDESVEEGVGEVLEKENMLLLDISLRKENIKPTGKVVGVIRRNWRPYCGVLQGGSDGVYHLFVPADKKLPKIRIETRQSEFLKTQKIIVSIDSWNRSSRYPSVSKRFFSKNLIELDFLFFSGSFCACFG